MFLYKTFHKKLLPWEEQGKNQQIPWGIIDRLCKTAKQSHILRYWPNTDKSSNSCKCIGISKSKDQAVNNIVKLTIQTVKEADQIS